MSIKQLSVFIPNRKGTLAELTGIFFKEGFDIRALSVYDTAEYGILRAVVDDPERAVEVLQNYGIVTKLSDVLTINPEDRRGSLNEAFKLMGDNNISIDYVYSFVVKKNEDQYFVLKVDDIAKAEKVFEENGVEVIKKL